jgi:uncharacterized delta-60 repeat protein
MLIFRHATRRLALSLLLVTLFPSQATAAPGDLDTTFSGDGWEQTDIRGTGGSDWGADAALQADGRIVLVGSSQAGNYTDFALARYNADGTLDGTFGDNGVVIAALSSRNDYASGVAIQADGAILVAGSAWAGRGPGRVFALVRYLTDGTLDPTFGSSGIVRTNFTSRGDGAAAVAIRPDGRIVAAGEAYPGDFAIVRYMPTGARDRSFSGDGRKTVNLYSGPTFPPGGSHDSATDVAIQVNGKIVVAGGTAWRWNNRVQTRLSVIRLGSAGGLDPAFGEDGKTLTRTRMPFLPASGGLALQPDGKVVAGGTADGVLLLVRRLRDGSRDPTFSENGIQKTNIPLPGDGCGFDFGLDLALQPDGKIVQAGSAHDFCNGGAWVVMARVQANGDIDTSFGDAGTVVTTFGGQDTASSVVLQADGKIVVSGSTATSQAPGSHDFLVARYLN